MSVALRGRRADWNLACGNHQGQWQTATKTGRTDDCTDQNAAEATKKMSCNAGAIHRGHPRSALFPKSGLKNGLTFVPGPDQQHS